MKLLFKHLESTKQKHGLDERGSRKSDGLPRGLPELSNRQEYTVVFCTNSQYDGFWDSLDMEGYGLYRLFYGVEYDGEVSNGMFNARGTIFFPNNSKMDGFWKDGRMMAHRYFHSDNLCFGPYCEMPDRRFHLELREGIRPSCKSLLTNSYTARTIPPGCYDTGDGFYDPVKMCVYDPIDSTKIIRIPTKLQHNWIIKNCRKAWNEPVKYKPNLYERWQDDAEQEESNENEKQRRNLRKSLDYLHYRRNRSFVNDNDYGSVSDVSRYYHIRM